MEHDVGATGTNNWSDRLARPVAFVLSGGASLGAIQVGMLRGLANVGVEPDLVVGTSVGSLNGAVVAQHHTLDEAVADLFEIWTDLRRVDVLPGSPLAQAMSVVRNGHLHPRTGLEHLIDRSLDIATFAELPRSLTVVAADVLTNHVRWFRSGPIKQALLAATALPGVFAPMVIEGHYYADAGPVANVPLQPAVEAGAGSIVVLDAGDVCHVDEPPRGIPDGLLAAAMTAMRQRLLIEAPAVAERVPMLYLPRPCTANRSLLDFDNSFDLVAPAEQVVAEFLATAATPQVGQLVGTPHDHEHDHAPGDQVGPT